MATLNYSVTATDGLLPSPDYQFTPLGDLSPQASTTKPQLTKIQVPNMTGLKDHAVFYVGQPSYWPNLYDLYFYDDASSSWKSGSFDDTHVLGNYLSIFAPFSNYQRKYVCLKATDEEHIPGKTEGGLYSRINEIPAVSSRSQYASVVASGGGRYIPITYHSFGTIGADSYLNFFGFFYNETKSRFEVIGANIKNSVEITNPSGYKVSTYDLILQPGDVPPNIDERVTRLEDRMAVVEGKITIVENQISTLTDRVDRLVSNNTSYFVSR